MMVEDVPRRPDLEELARQRASRMAILRALAGPGLSEEQVLREGLQGQRPFPSASSDWVNRLPQFDTQQDKISEYLGDLFVDRVMKGLREPGVDQSWPTLPQARPKKGDLKSRKEGET